MAYIDSRGAVHRDIKADNVLIDADDNAKLGDFGLAKKVSRILVFIFTAPLTKGYFVSSITAFVLLIFPLAFISHHSFVVSGRFG